MSLPPINPDKTAAGIALDPHTLERVIPESRRPDGTVRKQIKIRPGFTPQEDVRRFRGTKQAQQDANALPKGHIIGWAPPPTSQATSSAKPMSKSAKKNAKRREKKEEKKEDPVADNWEDDEEEPSTTGTASRAPEQEKAPKASSGHSPENPNWAAASAADNLATQLDKLDVK